MIKRKYTRSGKKQKPFINLIKVHDINPAKYSSYNFDYKAVEYKPDGTVEEMIKTKPKICSAFGCGKVLTLFESHCGNKCIKHVHKEEIDIMRYIKIK